MSPRWQSAWKIIARIEVQIDIAIIAAPTADPFGNANGLTGPSVCGLLGFALADAQYAHMVIVATDHLVDFPCVPWQIQGNYVDYVVTAAHRNMLNLKRKLLQPSNG